MYVTKFGNPEYSCGPVLILFSCIPGENMKSLKRDFVH